jgi:hypothetical protein
MERDPDIGLPVDRERLPGLVLEREDGRGRACNQNDGPGVVPLEEAGCQRRVTGVGDLGVMMPAVIWSGNAAAVRDTATTSAGLGEGRAIPWPRPRLAPTTIVVLSEMSLMLLVRHRCGSTGSS